MATRPVLRLAAGPSRCWRCGKQLFEKEVDGKMHFYFHLIRDARGEPHRVHNQCLKASVALGMIHDPLPVNIEPKVRERDIEKYLCESVEKLGGEVRKVAWIGRRGAPDRVVMLPPSVSKQPWVWVELKRPGGVVSAQQKREHERMRRYGQIVIVIKTKEEVDKWLNR